MMNTVGMSPWANKNLRADPPHFVLIGNPSSRRVALFQEALAKLELPTFQLISYLDLISGRTMLPDVMRPGSILRIESPDKDFEVERALLVAGAEQAAEEEFQFLSRREVNRLDFDRGRILCPRQWYLGFCKVLQRIETQLAECPMHIRMNQPSSIARMFDKRFCHEQFEHCGIPVPRSFGPVSCFDELMACMRQAGCRRVFVKPAHGSSASGVVAFQTNQDRFQATTTVETVRADGQLHLYNSRRIRTYRHPPEIAEMIDALCRHRVHVEQWIPKAGLGEKCFDLRVVVIANQVKHTVARMSRSPITNLHLLNERGDAAAVRQRMGDTAWEAVCRTCKAALKSFEGCLYAGIDVLVATGFRRHAVLEINAFGDLLPGVFHNGLDTYSAEVLALLQS